MGARKERISLQGGSLLMGCLIPTDQSSTHIHMGSVNWTWLYDLECWCTEICCSHTGALAPASWMHPLLNSVVISQRWRESYSLLLELSSPPRFLCLQILVLSSTCYVVWHTLPTLDRFILSFCTGGTDICLRVGEGTRLYFLRMGILVNTQRTTCEFVPHPM